MCAFQFFSCAVLALATAFHAGQRPFSFQAPAQTAQAGASTLTISGAGHYIFLDTCTSAAKRSLPAVCDDRPGVDREAVHQQVARDAIAFFDRTL